MNSCIITGVMRDYLHGSHLRSDLVGVRPAQHYPTQLQYAEVSILVHPRHQHQQHSTNTAVQMLLNQQLCYECMSRIAGHTAQPALQRDG